MYKHVAKKMAITMKISAVIGGWGPGHEHVGQKQVCMVRSRGFNKVARATEVV
jgi:hypothetical protein